MCSRTGSDANPGTREKPFATLSAARDATRKLKRDGLKTPVEVIVQEGTYYLAEPLAFSLEDSGTPECPITYKAADGAKVVLSGGKPLTGWRRVDDKLWALDTPQELPDFRLLRVGDRWATRVRHPNYDPVQPYTGGWLFADWGGQSWERGQFNVGVQNTHNVNARLTWKVRVAADGNYRVWLRYAHNMKTEIGDRSAIGADGGNPIPLRDLSDTGAWNTFRWSHVADLALTEGEHELQWVNLKGGGLNLDAWAVCDDETWHPATAMGTPQWWGEVQVKPPAEGKHLLIIQAEACTKAEGPEISVPNPCPPGTLKDMTFRPNDLPSFADVGRGKSTSSSRGAGSMPSSPSATLTTPRAGSGSQRAARRRTCGSATATSSKTCAKPSTHRANGSSTRPNANCCTCPTSLASPTFLRSPPCWTSSSCWRVTRPTASSSNT